MRGSAGILWVLVLFILSWMAESVHEISETIKEEPVSINLLKEQIESCIGRFKVECAWAGGTVVDRGLLFCEDENESVLGEPICLVKGDKNVYMRCDTIRFIDTSPVIVTDKPWYEEDRVVKNVREIECVRQVMGGDE